MTTTAKQLREIAAALAPRSADWHTGYAAGWDAAKKAHGSPGGRKGGRSTSEAKRRAARENGKKGGTAKKKRGTSPNEFGPLAHGPKKS